MNEKKTCNKLNQIQSFQLMDAMNRNKADYEVMTLATATKKLKILLGFAMTEANVRKAAVDLGLQFKLEKPTLGIAAARHDAATLRGQMREDLDRLSRDVEAAVQLAENTAETATELAAAFKAEQELSSKRYTELTQRIDMLASLQSSKNVHAVR